MPRLLRAWVDDLPLRAQGTLVAGIRGCDLSAKSFGLIDEQHGCSTGEGSADRQLVAFLRFLVMNPADVREVDIPGAFMQSAAPMNWKPSQFGHYPQHWVSHLFHAFEVVGYCHPDPGTRVAAFDIYCRFVVSLHLDIELKETMLARFCEDRIAAGTVTT